MLATRVAEDPDRVFAEYKDEDVAWISVTRAQFAHEVAQVAKELIAAGVGRADRVGLQASTRYEWAVLDFAIQAAGAITVPVYPTSSAPQVAALHPHWRNLADPDGHGHARILLFLPLAHVLARYIEVLALACGAVLGFSTPKTIAADLRSFQPAWLMVVPRVLDTFLNTVGLRAGGGLKGHLFRFSANVSRHVVDTDGSARGLLTLKSKVADALVLSKVREALGGQLRHVVCGGSRLSPDTARFFIGLGVRVMEGYGVTESADPLSKPCGRDETPRGRRPPPVTH